jgi:hypothetical protein
MAEIRELLDEINKYREAAEQEKYELPGMMSLAVNHPGILAYQVKTQPHYQQDMRRASFLGKVAGMRDRMVQEGRGVEFNDSLPQTLVDAVDRRDEQASPYWNRGVLAYGQPLRNGTDWMQSVSSTGLNAARMAAGVPNADVDFENSADRLALGALRGGNNPMQQAWETERNAEGMRPVADLSAFMEPEQKGARILPRNSPYESYAQQGLTDGTQVANEMGVTGSPGRALGMTIDVLTDPVTEIGTGIRALTAGKYLRGAAALGSEAAIPATFFATSEHLREEARKKAERYAQSN